MHYIIYGVSGCGKSTVGQILAQRRSLTFLDADDFHPPSNVDKMTAGIPLTDDDRLPWLQNLAAELKKHEQGVVLACSALKESYRKLLSSGNPSIHWVLLTGSYQLIEHRLKTRTAHFFNPDLLRSQFETLEIPEYGQAINIDKSPKEITDIILKHTAQTPTNMKESAIGLVGLGVMGSNLALNIHDQHHSISVYNRIAPGEEKVVHDFLQKHPSDRLQGFTSVPDFVNSLQPPRKIILMIPAGKAVDAMKAELLPFLSPNDMVIDAGNSHFKDTERRIQELKTHQIHWVGMGVSGGEKGARFGPSIMPGCSQEVYDEIGSILESIAAKSPMGKPCCTRVGEEGAGHFVKMIHNGIEYAEMALIAEMNSLLKLQHTHAEIAEYFLQMNSEANGSYLLEISAKILQKKEGEVHLIDLILDKAKNKGTGSWSVVAALELGQPANMIAEALQSRYHSAFKAERMAFSAHHKKPGFDSMISLDEIKQAYSTARLINHHQGFRIIRAASEVYGWDIDLSQLASIWMNGCIIRSKLMQQCIGIFEGVDELLKDATTFSVAQAGIPALEGMVQLGISSQTPLPVFGAALQSFYFMTTANSNANMIQAQRDFFGAHTYQRIDGDSTSFFHTEWESHD